MLNWKGLRSSLKGGTNLYWCLSALWHKLFRSFINA